MDEWEKQIKLLDDWEKHVSKIDTKKIMREHYGFKGEDLMIKKCLHSPTYASIIPCCVDKETNDKDTFTGDNYLRWECNHEPPHKLSIKIKDGKIIEEINEDCNDKAI